MATGPREGNIAHYRLRAGPIPRVSARLALRG